MKIVSPICRMALRDRIQRPYDPDGPKASTYSGKPRGWLFIHSSRLSVFPARLATEAWLSNAFCSRSSERPSANLAIASGETSRKSWRTFMPSWLPNSTSTRPPARRASPSSRIRRS